MNKHKSDMITWGMMLRKVPSIARALPRVVRGMNCLLYTSDAADE